MIFLTVNTYLIASWWDWQFGGSYGHRGFVDSLPLLAIGLARFFGWSARRPVAWTIDRTALSFCEKRCGRLRKPLRGERLPGCSAVELEEEAERQLAASWRLTRLPAER
ncbi:MAG TPA: hypothetical protein VHI99_12775, partial [Vicinamibacterales bacterium]|nr:hypothetical protein [Vicinamibacterales bacterium]